MYLHLISLFILCVLTLLPAHANAQSICGAVLGPGGHYQLTQDLACPRFVTVTEGATLDLGGFALTWTDFSSGGVILTGTGAQLRNGTLGQVIHEPLILAGTGGHTVTDITIQGPVDFAVGVLSDNNLLTNVRAQSIIHAAFSLFGDGNLLTQSQGTCMRLAIGCLAIAGDHNTVRETTILVTDDSQFDSGINVTGHSNLLDHNHVSSTGGPGIWVQGTGNTIRGNTVAGVPVALVDTNGCGANTWTGNQASTANPPCLLDAPPPPPSPPPPPPPSGPVASTPRDLNGDGTADLLWQHASGAIGVWFLDGNTVLTGEIIADVPDPAWQVIGTGDLDGDGHPDLVWQHRPTGRVGVWFLQGTTLADSAVLDPGLGWTLSAIGDLDNDGHADLVWRHATTGHIAVWLMHGKNRLAGVWLPTIPDMQWAIVAAEDVDGDGATDLVWQHAPTGQVGVWHMTGTTPTSSGSLANTGDPLWRIAAVGDVDADGYTDLVWQHATSGQVAAWLLHHGAFVDARVIAQVADRHWQAH